MIKLGIGNNVNDHVNIVGTADLFPSKRIGEEEPRGTAPNKGNLLASVGPERLCHSAEHDQLISKQAHVSTQVLCQEFCGQLAFSRLANADRVYQRQHGV